MKTLKQILEIVCDEFNLTPEEVLSRRKLERITDAKKTFCYLVRTIYKVKVKEVGAFLGIGHTVVTHHHQEMKYFVKTYPWWFKICDDLEYKIITS